LYYNCVKFHKNSIDSLIGVALTRYSLFGDPENRENNYLKIRDLLSIAYNGSLLYLQSDKISIGPYGDFFYYLNYFFGNFFSDMYYIMCA
jgi:hypothetical protein